MTDAVSVYQIWDIALKALTFGGLLVAAYWARHTYADTKEKEFYSVFWNQKLSLFLDVSSAAAKMATTDSVAEYNHARSSYWELFFGRLSMVEGKAVKEEMQLFASLVGMSGDMNAQELPRRDLEQPAYRLTIAMKKELGTAWRSPFQEL